jgi:phage minor structural protein
MTELYIFSQDDKLLTVLSESTGLVSAPLRVELNQVPDTPFSFTVESDIYQAKHVKEENRVVFRDKEGDLREYVIKEIDDIDNIDGPETTAICIPAFMDELSENYILDRRFTDKEAQEALNAALEGTRYIGVVEVSLGRASTNFYKMKSVDAIWCILKVWGGDFKDVVELASGRISARKILIKQRLGADRGARFEIDHNIEEIQRTILSYPVTAMYGWGASLEIEDEEGNHTGGYTRYIDFADVEWSKAKGHPVDKPKGQKWVGDPDALLQYGRKHNGQLLHRFGEFSNQDYEDPAELLWATWKALQEAKKPEVNYRLNAYLLDKKAQLGDTARAIDRRFSRPIEVQARIIAMEYDLLDIEGTSVVEIGQFLSAHQDNVYRDIEELKESVNKPKPTKPIDNGSFPDIKPGMPVRVEAVGGMGVIQLYWDYDSAVYINEYEVYGSQLKDFEPAPEHLLWRGKVSSFAHAVGTDKVWYYRIRAVNTRGTAGEFSVQVTVATHRVVSDDILFGEDIAAKLRELSEIAPLLAEGTVDFDMITDNAKNLIDQKSKTYTDEEILSTQTGLQTELNNRIGDVNEEITLLNQTADELITRVGSTEGTITTINQDIDTINGSLSSTITQLSNLDGTVSQQQTTINAMAGQINLKATQDSVDTLTGRVSSVEGEISVQSGQIMFIQKLK